KGEVNVFNLDRNRINLYDLLISLTNAVDLISPEVADHQQQVAYMAVKVAEQLGLPAQQRKTLMLAGLLHDMGALTLDERLMLIEDEPPSKNDHAFRGARLFEGVSLLSDAANVIRFHHVPWENGEGKAFDGNTVPMLSHIIHLADRIAVAIDKNRNIIGQISEIRNRIKGQKDTVFMPELVDAFLNMSNHEYLWLNLQYEPLRYALPEIVTFETVELNIDEVIELTHIFASIIDFRSPFTANHSAGVAKTAQKLAQLAMFSDRECKMMLIAGNLHDLGKLAVRRTILEKPDKLERDEFDEMRGHTFYTYRLLQSIKGFETITQWASFHHEKLDGSGYPFHLDARFIPLGSRIMAVADIFTAISEDRPYRKGIPKDKVISVLESMAKNGHICKYVVSLLADNCEEVNNIRIQAQTQASIEYKNYIRPELV
ncbi:MAG TPA: HD domain-containing protein, partial [Clostridia bacterium]|nr:HD domain-containing protein [Clostridia bacterium]